MYLTPTPSHWACDIEADGLKDEVTQIWCVCVENILDGRKFLFTKEETFKIFLENTPDAIFVGHNFLSYDAPVLNRIWGTSIGPRRVVDTFVLSQLYSPNLPRPVGLPKTKNTHSLEAWGLRVKHAKTPFHDFSHYTDEMGRYCANDTTLTAIVFRKLSARMRAVGFVEEGCQTESLAWHIIQNKQKEGGFPFNFQEGYRLYVELQARSEELKAEVLRLFPPRLGVVRHYKCARKKDGEPTADFIRHSEQFPKIELDEEGGYRAFDWIEFNLASPPQRIEKLLELGWKPTSFTKITKKGGGGNPQVNEDSLLDFAKLSGRPELEALAKWLVCNSRIKMLDNWLNAYNEKTGALHGNLWIAATLRYRHDSPNSSNVPAVRKFPKGHERVDEPIMGAEGAWAYECRDLYHCGDSRNYSLVGIDAKGIQLRILANYAYSDAFVARVLDGDPHTNNMEIIGLPTKAAAKKFFYTLLMGGGGALLAADQVQFGVHLTDRQASAKKSKLIAGIPGFKELIDKLQTELNDTGRIKLCDGTPILVPSPHMVIPYLLQGDESRIMKKALIWADWEVRKNALDARKVCDSHDEWQWVVRNDHVEKFGDLVLPCFKRAGTHFEYRVPIEGEMKVGKTWAETH